MIHHETLTDGRNVEIVIDEVKARGIFRLRSSEIKILPYLIAGVPGKVIADKICRSEVTIKHHAKMVRTKLGVQAGNQIPLAAQLHGLYTAEEVEQ